MQVLEPFLRDGLRILKLGGWQQHGFGLYDNQTVPHCAVGALDATALVWIDSNEFHRPNGTRDLLRRLLEESATELILAQGPPELQAKITTDPMFCIESLNDSKYMTKTGILNIYRRAIKKAMDLDRKKATEET